MRLFVLTNYPINVNLGPMHEAVFAILTAYPQVYHACHVDHPRARTNAGRISARDAWILGHLHLTEPVSPTALARHLSLRPSTISEAVRRLAALGYISRRTVPHDKRRTQLFLTANGAEAITVASVLDPKRVQHMLALLPASRRARAVQGLGLLAQAARALNAKEPKRWNTGDDS
jgi:DNA-binding MarR family transcriptional regulator